MKRALFLTLALVAITALAASAAMASRAPVEWFYDNFDSYASNTRLRQAAPNWCDGTGPENRILTSGCPEPMNFQAVRLKGQSGTGSDSDAVSSEDGLTPSDFSDRSAGKIQILHYLIQADPYEQNASIGNHGYIYLDDAEGEMGRWYGYSQAWTPRYDGHVGPGQSLADALPHDCDMVYDPISGIMEWYFDGGKIWEYDIGTGRACTDIYVFDDTRPDNPGNDYLWVDDMSLGTVPEPSSLLALGMFGVGMLGYIKRRKA